MDVKKNVISWPVQALNLIDEHTKLSLESIHCYPLTTPQYVYPVQQSEPCVSFQRPSQTRGGLERTGTSPG